MAPVQHGPSIEGFNQIWILDERRKFFRQATREPVPLTLGPLRWETPQLSKDGQKIFAAGATPRGELVRFNSKSRQLEPYLGGISAEWVSFSRDGSQMTYVTYPDGVLWRAKADGTDRVRIATPPPYPWFCDWSPDGTQVLFMGQRTPTEDLRLYTVSAQGGSPVPLVPGEAGEGQQSATWSPDGKKIVYGNHRPRLSLHIFDLDRQQSTEIPGSEGLLSPRLSADGKYIAAMTDKSMAIKLFDLQRKRWSTLVENMGVWGFPTFSHDGKFLYLLNVSAYAVYRVPVTGGKPTRVVDLTGFQTTGAVGYWFGLDPEDAPLLLRYNGTKDIYALTLERK